MEQPERPSQSQLEADWEVMTATDSDDDDADADFMEAYDLALQAQLAGTKMSETFEGPPAAAGAAGAASRSAAGAAAGPDAGCGQQKQGADEDGHGAASS